MSGNLSQTFTPQGQPYYECCGCLSFYLPLPLKSRQDSPLTFHFLTWSEHLARQDSKCLVLSKFLSSNYLQGRMHKAISTANTRTHMHIFGMHPNSKSQRSYSAHTTLSQRQKQQQKKQTSRSNLTRPLPAPTLRRYQQKHWNSPSSSQIHLIYECVSSSANLLLTHTQTTESKWSTTTNCRALQLVERVLMRAKNEHSTQDSCEHDALRVIEWQQMYNCLALYHTRTHKLRTSSRRGKNKAKGEVLWAMPASLTTLITHLHRNTAVQEKGGCSVCLQCTNLPPYAALMADNQYNGHTALPPNPREHCQLPLWTVCVCTLPLTQSGQTEWFWAKTHLEISQDTPTVQLLSNWNFSITIKRAKFLLHHY